MSSSEKLLRSKQACDVCRARKRKCDGNKPCASCQKQAAKSKKPVDCVYSKNPAPTYDLFKVRKLNSEIMERLHAIEKVLARKGDDVLSASDTESSIVKEFRLLKFLETSGSFLESIEGSPLTHGDNYISRPSEDVVKHLLSLSELLYIGFTVDNDLNYVPLNCRDRPLSPQLQKSICYHASFLSTHPQLFNGNPNPTWNDRIELAKMFSLDLSKGGLQNYSGSVQATSPEEEIDNFRANLIHSMTLACLNRMGEAMNGLALTLLKVKNAGFLQRNVIIGINEPEVITCDELFSKPGRDLSNLTPIEQHELISFLAYCFIVDSFAAATQNCEFLLDSSLIPVLEQEPLLVQPQGTFDSRRTITPTLAENTIWANSTLSTLFDDLMETSNVFKDIPAFQKHRLTGVLKAAKIFRKIIEFSKKNRFGVRLEEVATHAATLHHEVLELIANIPFGILPFDDLHSFAPNASPFFPKKRHLKSFEVYTLISGYCFMLSYLHLPLIQAGKKPMFSLSISGTAQYTSEEILFTSVNVLRFLYESSSEPLLPAESLFDRYDYPFDKLETAMHTKSIYPSPLVMCPSQPMIAYAICSSAVIGLNATSSPELLKKVKGMIEVVIMPGMERIGNLWPIGKAFAGKLADLISEDDKSDMSY